MYIYIYIYTRIYVYTIRIYRYRRSCTCKCQPHAGLRLCDPGLVPFAPPHGIHIITVISINISITIVIICHLLLCYYYHQHYHYYYLADPSPEQPLYTLSLSLFLSLSPLRASSWKGTQRSPEDDGKWIHGGSWRSGWQFSSPYRDKGGEHPKETGRFDPTPWRLYTPETRRHPARKSMRLSNCP